MENKYEVTLKYYSYSPSGGLEEVRTEIENFFVDVFNGNIISIEVVKVESN